MQLRIINFSGFLAKFCGRVPFSVLMDIPNIDSWLPISQSERWSRHVPRTWRWQHCRWRQGARVSETRSCKLQGLTFGVWDMAYICMAHGWIFWNSAVFVNNKLNSGVTPYRLKWPGVMTLQALVSSLVEKFNKWCWNAGIRVANRAPHKQLCSLQW